jgi:hypothetical protein
MFVLLIILFSFLCSLKNQSDTHDDPPTTGADVQYGSPQPISARPFVSKKLMARRSL